MSVEAMQWAFGNHREIHDGPRLVLLALAWLADPHGVGEAKHESVGYMAAMSRSSVQRHLRVLEAAGVVTRAPTAGRGLASPFQLAMENVSTNRSPVTPFAENVSAVTRNSAENVAAVTSFTDEKVSTNRSTVTPFTLSVDGSATENVSENVSAVTPFTPPRHLSTRIQNSARTRTRASEEVTPRGRAREAAATAYVPGEAILDHLMARGLRVEEVDGAVAQYRAVRSRNSGEVSDDNFRSYVVARYLPTELGRAPLPDMSAPAVSRQTAESVRNTLGWTPPDARGGRPGGNR